MMRVLVCRGLQFRVYPFRSKSTNAVAAEVPLTLH